MFIIFNTEHKLPNKTFSIVLLPVNWGKNTCIKNSQGPTVLFSQLYDLQRWAKAILGWNKKYILGKVNNAGSYSTKISLNLKAYRNVVVVDKWKTSDKLWFLNSSFRTWSIGFEKNSDIWTYLLLQAGLHLNGPFSKMVFIDILGSKGQICHTQIGTLCGLFSGIQIFLCFPHYLNLALTYVVTCVVKSSRFKS